MAEPKPFYEIEKPAKKTYAVVVIEIKNDTECKHTIPFFNRAGGKLGALLCDTDFGEIYDCACCGLTTCDFEHMSQTIIHGEGVCKICEQLPPGIMEAIIKLREDINQS